VKVDDAGAARADEGWMRLAHEAAQEAFARGDWPAGAAVVRDGRCLASGQNRQETGHDPTLHAETQALRSAIAAHGAAAVRGATLYTTMEPCPMCAGALKVAGVARIVAALRMAELGRRDLGGYSIENFCALVGWHPQLAFGVLHDDCLALRRRWGRDAQLAGESPS
jgi:tRNA(adenine34) deaminase